jgi:alginate O-acetyltransferase complex protein AlgI
MLFHTHEFFALLALICLGFWLLPSMRRVTLLAGSIAFYAYAGIPMTVLFVSVSWISWRCFRLIRAGHRWAMPIGLFVNFANLFTFKYTTFFLLTLGDLGVDVGHQLDWVGAHFVLPVGISFYTFQLVAALVDEWREPTLDVRSFAEWMLFVSFLGQLIAGPIMRGNEFFPQLHRFPGPRREQLIGGTLLFITGLFKKAILTDRILGPRVDELFAQATAWDTPSSWLLGLLFGFQIYFDFSGYVDMALGIGKFFGLELRPNFSTPYVSRTPSEFWSRWNITLSRWFGDYVYIPLGGSRGGHWRTMRNLMLTMLASGLWHGAGFTFLIWGGIHGLYLVCFHTLRWSVPVIDAELVRHERFGPLSVASWALTFVVTVVSWVYFRAASVAEANAVVSNMFGLGDGTRSTPLATPAMLCIAFLALHFLERAWLDRFERWVPEIGDAWMRIPGPVQAAFVAPCLVILLGVTKKVQGAFIYFQF